MCRLFFSLVNKYMARELKEGYDKFPPAQRCLVHTVFPTDGNAELLEGCSITVLACAEAGGGSCDPRLSQPPTVGP